VKKSPTRKRKSCVRKRRKKINEMRKMRKRVDGKALMRVPKRKGTRIEWSRMRRSVNGKGHD
jgi:hypothetical protein